MREQEIRERRGRKEDRSRNSRDKTKYLSNIVRPGTDHSLRENGERERGGKRGEKNEPNTGVWLQMKVLGDEGHLHRL